MARGKHSQAAAVRREAHEQQAEIGTYQRKIVELLAENKKLKEEAAARSASHQQQIARLAIQIQEGTSPALAVAQKEAGKLREERDHAVRRLRERQKLLDSFMAQLITHALEAHHMNTTEALRFVDDMVGDKDELLEDGGSWSFSPAALDKVSDRLYRHAPPGVQQAQYGRTQEAIAGRLRTIQLKHGERRADT
jgi:hypothetical protein